MTFSSMQHMHHHANYMHRPPEMASLPAAPTAATPSPSRCENPHSKKEKKKKNKSSSDEKRVRKSRSDAEDQPEANQHQPKRPTGPQQFISFGMAPPTVGKQPQQLTSMDVDGESMVSGYIYTGMDRDIAEEFILHSMTIPAQAGSVKSGFSATDKREMF